MYSSWWCATLVGAVCLSLVSTTSEPNAFSPVLINNGEAVQTYHGVISENQETVTLSPPLFASDSDKLGGAKFICGYKLFRLDDQHIPFGVELKNHTSGEAYLVLNPKEKLDFEKRQNYAFSIVAYDCGSPELQSDSARVHIRVLEVARPSWERESYFAKIEEGPHAEPLLKVTASETRTAEQNKICSYKVITPNVPFEVDNQGNIRLAEGEDLKYDEQHNHILAVEAIDCQNRTSKPVMVNIQVYKKCDLGWKGIPNRIEYEPRSGRNAFAEHAKFDKCEVPCEPERVSSSVFLTTKHIGKGCDRDTYSIKSQRKLCGASAGSVDLLPTPDLFSSWTKDLPHDDGKESDQIYAFDGKTNAVQIPDGKINHTMGSHFTVMAWLKHEQNVEDTKRGEKEHIMCNADGEEMNRHHYSVFVHNCRLVFLLRQEYSKGHLNIFKPAEWRWRIPEICDNEWHHYAISVDFPQIRLYIDGSPFIETKRNPEIIDDWPLHKTKEIHFTKLVVGACWQGGEKTLSQHFKGYMAGLSILRGKTESDRVIKCLNNCKEKLDFHAVYLMDGGMSISYNSEMTQISINGHNITEVQRILSQVGYINFRTFPTPGRRNLKITTNIKCKNSGVIKVPDVNSYIQVLDGQTPKITIGGIKTLAKKEEELEKIGQQIFPDLIIMTSMGAENEKETKEKTAERFASYLFKSKVFANAEPPQPQTAEDHKQEYKLDSCVVKTFPPMSADEKLNVPENAIHAMGLEASVSKSGIVITGADKMINYETVLREVHYLNRNPAAMTKRSFTLTCSELNGRFVSNDFEVTVEVIHSLPEAHTHADHAQANNQANHLPNYKAYDTNKNTGSTGERVGTNAVQGTSVGMFIIIVVCVGFLIFMIILGVIRIRTFHKRVQVLQVDEKQEMEWDNSALTITVNPMESDDMGMGAGMSNFDEFATESLALRDDSDSEDDDGSSYHDDIESSEDEAEKVKDSQLEWDDSTLTF
ncbi:calsyntenin-1-like isoform X3 [Lineus longissimus]|uniref:calsyntenin-1-like isoform X3 n=1 Tax=Lineus longissimus TaxID=88925 RepID=UPI00315C6D9A